MTDHPGDIDLYQSTPPDSDPPPSRRRPPVGLLVAIGVLLVALGAAYMFLRRAPSEPSPSAAATQPSVDTQAQRGEPGEQIVLPPLDETDALVRQLVDRLSSQPMVAAWLTTEGLIVNFVVVTSRIARGETPVAELKAVGPIPRFRVRNAGDAAFIDPSSYRRYDRHAAAISSLDARGTARLYATLKPRIADAYGRLGKRDGEFDMTLERAIIEMLEVPVIEGDIELVPHGVVYAFADERLQDMSAAQKQLFRMGPQNVRVVQGKLREIATAVGIPPSRLPPPERRPY